MVSRSHRLLLILSVLALVLAACRSDAEVTIADPQGPPAGVAEDEQAAAVRPTVAPTSAPLPTGGEVDFRLDRDDIECGEESLSSLDEAAFVVAHVVVGGNLGAACFGEPDDRLLDAWNVLSLITPPGQLGDLGLFGGFVSGDEEETTLAYVNTLDYDGTLYQMSVNLDEAEADRDELLLTMAHEFAHVFTSLSTQIDRYAPIDSCETWDNGEGCFLDDSLMWAWIEEFWGDGLIDEIDPFGEPTGAAGEQRCSLDPSFLGSYAASNPEEDFAETFSAFVFRLPVDTVELQEKMDWLADQPGLAEFRDRAIENGLGPLDNEFELCG